MKHTKLNKIILSASIPTLGLAPCTLLASCNYTKLAYSCMINNLNYFAWPIDVGHIYLNRDLTFSFELKSQCYLDYSESYFKVEGHRSHSFDSSGIMVTHIGNQYTVKINKSLIQDGFVTIYLCAYKMFNFDSSESSSDIQIESSLTSYPIEKEPFTIGFKVNNNKALDLSKSTIKVNDTAISNDLLYVWDKTIDGVLYTFITIPEDEVTGDISVNLQTSEAIDVVSATYPEYKVECLSKTAKGSDFYMYFILTDGYTIDTDKAVIKVGETPLTTADYSFKSYFTIPYLKINGSKVTDKVSIDVPPVQCFTLYANKPEEYPTVEVEGDEIIKDKEYKFSVSPLNGKTIQWEHPSTYITVNDTKITLNNGFTYTQDPESKEYIVTVKAEYAIGDLYCHFITL